MLGIIAEIAGQYLGSMCAANSTCEAVGLVTMAIIGGVFAPYSSMLWM